MKYKINLVKLKIREWKRLKYSKRLIKIKVLELADYLVIPRNRLKEIYQIIDKANS